MAEADELVPVFLRDDMCFAEAPVPFEAGDGLHELGVVAQLRVHYFDVF